MRSCLYLSGLLSFVAAINGAIAAVAPIPATDFAVVESLPKIPQGWQQGAPVPAGRLLRFRIAVKQDNAFAFEQHVIDISTPTHAKYGQHMSREELKAMLRPSTTATAAILVWLTGQGVPAKHIEDKGDWINFYVPTINAESMLNTKFYYYSDAAGHVKEIRTLRYSVPQQLHEYIHMIQPTTRFGHISPSHSSMYQHFVIGSTRDAADHRYPGSGLNATFCNSTITPQCIKDLYGLTGYNSKAVEGNTIGIGGFLKQWAKYKDFSNFTKLYAPYAQNQTFEYELINGGLSTQNSVQDSGEANLDVQYALPLSYPAKATYYSTGGLGDLVFDLDQPNEAANQNEPYLDFLHYLLELPNKKLPTTLSISYGENEQSVPKPYANQTCSLFAQLGARGVSVLFSSGDTGVSSACQTNDGTNTTRFLPVFPAACPFVTAVGGTYRVQPERAISFSAGGFSDIFPRPAYQEAAVTEYLRNLGDTWKGLYNPAGRGFPDVAAQSYNFTIIDGGREGRAGGTSASAPVFAGIVSLLNGARISSGRPPLGFLNPFIYSFGYRGLNDIIDGGSKGCTGTGRSSGVETPVVPFASWNATKGWDPVTGYGTPNFPRLLRLSRYYYYKQ
ncbi:vesicle formation at the endoplasmic reticulum [Pseudocyphellaria aurata]|nr:vesicle formation at the endoplasmic reticulum [Pseudocyphellaria aurata]